MSWGPQDSQAHQDPQVPQDYLEKKGTTASQAPQDPGGTLASKATKGMLGSLENQGLWRKWTWAA